MAKRRRSSGGRSSDFRMSATRLALARTDSTDGLVELGNANELNCVRRARSTAGHNTTQAHPRSADASGVRRTDFRRDALHGLWVAQMMHSPGARAGAPSSFIKGIRRPRSVDGVQRLIAGSALRGAGNGPQSGRISMRKGSSKVSLRFGLRATGHIRERRQLLARGERPGSRSAWSVATVEA